MIYVSQRDAAQNLVACVELQRCLDDGLLTDAQHSVLRRYYGLGMGEAHSTLDMSREKSVSRRAVECSIQRARDKLYHSEDIQKMFLIITGMETLK